MGIDEKIIKQAEDACKPGILHEIGKVAKDTLVPAAVGAAAGSLVAPGPGSMVGGIVGAVGGIGYSLNGIGKPEERCVAEHVVALDHVATHGAPLSTPAEQTPVKAKIK